ncbi:antibiotic biosynthesis monooxygenase [Microbacterium sp. zg.B48]|uniref:putative quinol monooxygenase n=1 Tax=unclassified Microbacterium TaxID=2609290 RepID=UPI00214C0E08|nr:MULTISPECIES: antibiotic biosynthesis monooxygenase family protein [unclassified Microbacterium]MCR2765052.1 antibiotic biosynthesis monooxygenase [Microbacterium sp. zg.B48]MCR2811231.1 antibiotic biosynthesis monooxygenase [Microbacterium sp. zg.B185]WIM19830.1 antibiotic biosynthesis monooxygenase family protein [Microbacterium sp. zg-B185]
MSERIAALVRFTFREDALERVPAIVKDMLDTTRTFAGLEQLDILRDPERPGLWTLYEIWSDDASEQAYRSFRATPEGGVAGLAEVIAERPSLERFTIEA